MKETNVGLSVGKVAELASVSVRTLHHYDEVGLLSPSARSEAGYRFYDDADLARLQQILFYRELGFGLEDIGKIMSDPEFDRRDALIEQRRMLERKSAHIGAMLEAIDRALDASQKGIVMNKEEMFEVFGDFDPAEYEDEVKERWGDTDAYKESNRRASAYTKQDWERIKAEGAEQMERMIALFDEGASPEDPRSMDVAEAARLSIDRNFYPCSYEMHVNLGEMYIADPRFTKYYDQHRDGLAQWFCDAVIANALREE